jgi:arylformamidase
MLLATDWPALGCPDGLVPAAMPISGLFDLVPLTHTTINTALGLDEAEARRLSPLFLEPPRGRIHAYVGGEEGREYERQSRSIADAWGGTWESLPRLHHFNIIEQLQDRDSAMVAKALSLLPD